MVLLGDVLCPQVLLHGQGKVRAALHGGVVGHHHDVAARHAADASDDAGTGGLVVVQPVGGQRRQFEEGRARVEQAGQPLAHGQLALLAMPLERAGAAALGGFGDAVAVLLHQLPHAVGIGLELGVRGDDVCGERVHGGTRVLQGERAWNVTSRSSRS